MKIIISPAKTMNVERDIHDIRFLPYFLDETKILMDEIRKLSFDESKALWKCNDKLAIHMRDFSTKIWDPEFFLMLPLNISKNI